MFSSLYRYFQQCKLHFVAYKVIYKMYTACIHVLLVYSCSRLSKLTTNISFRTPKGTKVFSYLAKQNIKQYTSTVGFRRDCSRQFSPVDVKFSRKIVLINLLSRGFFDRSAQPTKFNRMYTVNAVS